MNHSELAHKWAHAAPGMSRRSGSMSFNGSVLYSYATPIAMIYRRKKPVYIQHGSASNRPVRTEACDTLVLVSEHNYSASTSKHIGLAFQAVSHLHALRVPRYILGEPRIGRYHGGASAKEDHAANLEYFAAKQARMLKEAGRAMSERAVEFRAEEAARAHKAMADYMMFFGIRRKMPALLSFAAAYERARRIENPDPASADKREQASAQRKQRLHDRDEYLAEQKQALQRGAFYRLGAQRTDWRLFGAMGTQSAYYPHNHGAVMLRVNGDDIETSQGARVPVTAAPMVWELVQRARHAGGYENAGFGKALRSAGRVRIGDYPLDRIDADGTLHAGCHVIPYSELSAMARALNLVQS